MISWVVSLFKCKHKTKKLLWVKQDYAEPHCRVVGLNTTSKCLDCGEIIKNYHKYEGN
jgi:hypothetical protein